MNARNESPVVIAIPGDLHLTERGLPNYEIARWAIAEANEIIRPDFVQFIGDNVQDARLEQFELFRESADRLRCPWYALVGDHDASGDPAASAFRARVGEPCGALRLRGFRFLRLNTQDAEPKGLTAPQLDWFRAEVDAALKEEERVVVFQHHYPYQIWEDFAGPGLDGWREVVQTRRIHAVFSGHTHYGQIANDGRNIYYATRSIGDPEGGPAGYALVYLQGEDLAVTYRTPEDRGPLVLATHPRDVTLATGPAHVVCGSDEVRARIWSRAPLLEVSASIDDEPPFPLAQVGSNDWSVALVTDRLAKGVHRLCVRAVDRIGEIGEQRIEFAYDATGRFTAVPGVHPPVRFTRFC